MKVKLSEILDLQNGFAFNSSDYIDRSDTYNCRMSNIRPGGEFDIDYNPKYLPDTFSDSYSQYLLRDGDLIVAMTDLANDPKILGVPAIVKTQGKNLLLNQRVGKLVIKDHSRVYIPFLKHALNRKEAQKYYSKFSGGGLQINLGKNDLLSYSVHLPTMTVQKFTALVLDKADTLRKKDKQLLQYYDDLAQSLFIDMFGDPMTNKRNWKYQFLGEVCSRITDGEHATPLREENGIKLLSARNIKNGFIDFDAGLDYIGESEFARISKRCNPKPNDVLMSCSGSVGRVATINFDERISLVRSVALITPINSIAASKYIEYFLRSQFGQLQIAKRTKTSSQANIFTGAIKQIPIAIPPIALQNQFAQQIQNIEQQKEKLKLQMQESENLFQALLQKAFNGGLN